MFAKIKNNTVIKYPYTFADLQNENPYTNYGANQDVAYWYPQTEDAIVNGYELVNVESSTSPVYNEDTQRVSETTPILINNIWYQSWEISDLPEAIKEQKEQEIRDSNKSQALLLLQSTDWVELPSVINTSNIPHLINASEFVSYRNALRIIALNPPSTQIEFPVEPTEQWTTA